jgi:uncharacterized protein DUF4336
MRALGAGSRNEGRAPPAAARLTRMLEPLAPNLWVAEAPLRWLGVELGRRMTVIRLSGGELLVHSPAPLTAELRDALGEVGEVRFVVPASRFHGHLYMEQYRAAYSNVELFAAPGLERRRRDLSFDGYLGDDPDPRWREDVDQVAFLGSRFLTEIVFLHRPSGSLILGDLCMNLGPDRPLLSRAYVRLDGVAGRFAMPRTIRLTARNRDGARQAVQRMLEWDFDRVVTGHGDVLETGGHQAFHDALEWLLRGS